LLDHQVRRLLEDEVCSNLSVLAPELTVCMEAAERLCRSPSSQVHGTQALASSAAHRSRLLAKSSALEKQVSEHERR